MDSNPICHPSPAKKIKFLFLEYVQLLMISQAVQWTRTPSPTPLQLTKIKFLFLDYVQLLMIGHAGQKTWTLSTTPLQPKKWNACFRIMFNFWWSAGMVSGLKPHLPPLSGQKNKILVFGLCSTSDDWPRWSIDLNPVCLPSPVKKWNACFWIMFNFWWSARLVNGLEPPLPPLSSQKN